MEKTCAASAMEWSIQLEKGLRSKKPGGTVEAILQIGPRLQLWSREPESNMAANGMFGLVVGEDKLFANAILLRLADAFVLGDKDTRLSIVRVFLSELKHRDKIKHKQYNGLLSKARVPNYLELLKRVKSVFDCGDEESRALTLVLFGCWADFAQDNAQIRYLVLSSLISPHAWLVKASLFAAGCFCEISDDFACVALEMLVNMVTSSEITLPVKLDAARVFTKFRCSYSVANKAYKTGVELILNSSNEEFLVAMFFSLSKLSFVSTHLITEQVGLLLSFLNRERNLHIQETALRCLKFLVVKGIGHHSLNSDIFNGLFFMLEEPKVSVAMKCEALQVLHKVLLCMPPLPNIELDKFVKLLTVAENAIQQADLMTSHLTIRILADLSCRSVGGTSTQIRVFCSSSLPSRVVSLIKDQIKLLVMPLLVACNNYSKLFQDLQSQLKILLYIVRRHPYLGVLVLDNINSTIEYLLTIKTTGQVVPSTHVVVKFDRDKYTATVSKVLRKVYRFLVACLDTLNKVHAIDTEVLNRVHILVEFVCQSSLSDCYTYTMYCLLLHSQHIWGGVVHQDNGNRACYNLSICPHSCTVECKIDTLGFVNKILTETDNWTAYRVGAYAACQGEWLFSTAIFSKLIPMVQSEFSCNWLKALFQYTHSEGIIQLLSLPKQVSTFEEWLENNNCPLISSNYLDEKDSRGVGSVNSNHYFYKLAAAHGGICSSMGILEAAVSCSQAFCFQRWYLTIRARVLENVASILKVVTVLLNVDLFNQVEVEGNDVLGCLKFFEDISQISFQFLRLAEEFDLIGTSFLEMDGESSEVIAALALSCSLLAFISGFTVSVIHHHSHGSFAVDKNSRNLSLALAMQNLVGRLWHLDHETSTKFSSLLNYFEQPASCVHLQPLYQTCNIGFKYREFLGVCRDAVSGAVCLQDELSKEHNERTPFEATKSGLLLILNTTMKWIHIPFGIPKNFFRVRQVVGSELFVHNDDRGNGLDMSVSQGSNLSLNLCLQLKFFPKDHHVQPKRLYCILYCPVSFRTPTPRGQATTKSPSGYESWKDGKIIKLNKKLYRHVLDRTANNNRSGKHDKDDDNNKAVEAYLQFVPNQKGQAFSSCLLDVSEFPEGSYRIKWHSCLVDNSGSYWSLLPLNMGPVFTIRKVMDM